ncbi:benzoate/H(+) symporter BenE family transporter [Scleromatobacter humisilvae]|uniref:Benzoate/H(+) symporter BenE family transporter n=1 Tax=Scleromatobacter humisilvae TaxID=2897159 RepID=A0A9X2C224_9BURK|nr:benzoate/H(+) symporter BenE family transporter [Scleromatobacter humisilvae]MCK9688817.1 benzoate/H(+) symporter BenE family transporter [Scleromatobacter humisilvae]
MLKDVSFSAVVAGFIAVLVGFTSSVAIVFQAAQGLGATPEQTTSWMWALGVGTGLTSIGLSLWYRQPVLTAWSTPGAALLAATHGMTLPVATGAFIVSAVLITIAGASGLFERLMDRVPVAIAAALLAGVLTRFGLDAALAARGDAALVATMALVFVLGRRFWPRFAVPGVLLAGIAIAGFSGRIALAGVQWGWARPQFVMPEFSLAAAIGLGLPLFLVTMASQNLPGVAAQRAAGVTAPVSPVIASTGLATLLLAPFGSFGINLAAITAAICMGPEAHPDPRRRYIAPLAAGICYLLIGLGGGAVVGLMAAFPHALVVAVAGLALLGTIAGALASALAVEKHRDAAAITFLVTLSGVTLAGIGAPFWGVMAGAVALGVQHFRTSAPPPR